MKVKDPAEVRKQYQDSSNLGARIALHERFNTSDVEWPVWVFDRLQLKSGSRVVEVGGGPGILWRSNLDRLAADCSVTVTDLSPGMVAEARAAIGDERFTFRVADAQQLPFPDASFDIVVANHMLYHVPDLDAALIEFARVLVPGGRLVAATNGRGHMPELIGLLEAVGLAGTKWSYVEVFGLENGVESVGRHFDDVGVERCPGALDVTEAQAVLDYVSSLPTSRVGRRDGAGAEILERVNEAIGRDGAFRITTDAGLITARKR